MSFILLGILNSQAAGAGPTPGGPSYDLLETTVLTSTTASVEFTGLGAYTDYKHLQIRGTVRSTRSANTDTVRIQYNNDTGANYAYHPLQGNGSTVVSVAVANDTDPLFATCPAASASTGSFGGFVMDILDFSSSTKNTTTRTLGGHTEPSQLVMLNSVLYASTNAITDIKLFTNTGDAVTGSRFSLYGIKAA